MAGPVTIRDMVIRALEDRGPSTITQLIDVPILAHADTTKEYLYKLLPRMEKAGQVERLSNKPVVYRAAGMAGIKPPYRAPVVSQEVELEYFESLKIGETLTPVGKSLLEALNNDALPAEGIDFNGELTHPTHLIVMAAKSILLEFDSRKAVSFLQDLAQAIQVYDI